MVEGKSRVADQSGVSEVIATTLADAAHSSVGKFLVSAVVTPTGPAPLPLVGDVLARRVRTLSFHNVATFCWLAYLVCRRRVQVLHIRQPSLGRM